MNQLNGMIARYSSSSITLNNGDPASLLVDVNGNLSTTLGTSIAGENAAIDVLDVRQKGDWYTITADQIVYSGQGYLNSFVVANPIELTSGLTVLLYDGESAGAGDLIGTYRIAGGAGIQPVSIPCNFKFNAGLYVDLSAAAGTPSIVFSIS